MPFTEFCCRAGGSNLNAGTRKGDSTEPGTSANFTYTAGGFVTSTRVFTATGTIDASIVAGDFVSIYDSSLSPTSTPYIARVTGVTSNTITVSATAFAGVKPAADIVGTAVCVVGGAWQGPTGAIGFPLTLAGLGSLTDATINRPRVNFKNDQTYSITATITEGNPVAQFRRQGYTASYGDGGKATIDGGTTGTSYVLLLVPNFAGSEYTDLIFQNNGATGAAVGVNTANVNSTATFRRCVVNNVRGGGFNVNSNLGARFIECEAYKCNQSNTAQLGGFVLTGGISSHLLRCLSHDNDAGGNTSGFVLAATATLQDCIADTNGQWGIGALGSGLVIINCDCYNNVSDGILGSGAGGNQVTYIENCNLIKNGGWGINTVGGAALQEIIVNCGFGAGTMANTLGTINAPAGTDSVEVIGSINYASGVTPWVDPVNGDFRINPSQTAPKAAGAGRGAFQQTTPLTGPITGATNATPIVITAPRIMRTGETVVISGVGGNTNANGTWVVTNVTATTFSLNGSAGNAAYTSGGTFSVAYTGTVGFPDLGAAQHADSGGGVAGLPASRLQLGH